MKKPGKSVIPVSFNPEKVCCEIPYGYIYRPVDGHEFPAHRWIDVTKGNYGVSLMNNGRYGHSVLKNIMGITAIRHGTDPDPNSDEGVYSFTYSLMPHKGDWVQAKTVTSAIELNNPLNTNHSPSKKGKLPVESSYVSVDKDNIVVSAVKKCEDDNSIIVRLYESCGKKTDAKLVLYKTIKKAVEVDLLEREEGKVKTAKNTVSLKFGANEIKCVKIRF